MKPLLVLSGICLLSAACGSSSSPTTPTPTPTSTTRVIGLSGNLTFGDVAVGSTTTSVLTIANTGNATLTVTGLSGGSNSASYTASWTSGTIAAGGSQVVTIRFAPTAAISYSGTLTVSGDQTSGTNTIPLSASGSAASLIPLTGVVTASSGARISGATVGVLDGPNAGRTATTSNGDYRFNNLTVGNANLSANASGFSQTINGVFINGANTLNFILRATPTPAPTPTPTPSPSPSPAPSPSPSPNPTPTPSPSPPSAWSGSLPPRTSGSHPVCQASLPSTASCVNDIIGTPQAICDDSRYSCSTGSGTCSGHGGVYCWRN